MRAQLKADRARNDIVVAGCLPADVQRPFPIFAADSEASLHHDWEHEYRHCPICALVRRAYLVEELTERRLHLRLDLRPRCGLTWRCRPGRHDRANKKGKTACPYSRPDTHSKSAVDQSFSRPNNRPPLNGPSGMLV